MGSKNNVREREGALGRELPNVLWAYHTAPKESTGKILFKLSFIMEVIVPIKILSKTGKIRVKSSMSYGN